MSKHRFKAKKSTFGDIGSGLGKPLIHCCLAFDQYKSYTGIEMVELRYKFSLARLQTHVLKEHPEMKDKVEIRNENVAHLDK